MKEPRYPAARASSARLAGHFAREGATHLAGESARPPSVDAAAIEALIDAAFWASLKREEGYAPEISLAFLPPEGALRPLVFAVPLPLGPSTLSRLAPAVERPGIHLGVWRAGGTSWCGARPAPFPASAS